MPEGYSRPDLGPGRLVEISRARVIKKRGGTHKLNIIRTCAPHLVSDLVYTMYYSVQWRTVNRFIVGVGVTKLELFVLNYTHVLF